MAQKNGHNCANGVFSGLLLACGVVLAGLLGGIAQKAVDTALDSNAMNMDGSSVMVSSDADTKYAIFKAYPLWSLGFAFIVPAVIGLIATCVQAKGGYITHFVFVLISLIVMAIFAFIAIITLGALTSVAASDTTNCITKNDLCKCGDDLNDNHELLDTLGKKSCEDISAIFAMVIAVMVFIVVGWVVELVTCILTGILMCRSDAQPGVVFQPAGATTTVVQMGGMPPHMQTHYAPVTHDRAVLVQNAQY